MADVTAKNPNVFYEVGLSHALRRPTLLVTQSEDDVPFDLRSYRMIQYGTGYELAGEFKEKLRDTAQGILEGQVRCTGPVDDFLPLRAGLHKSLAAAPKEAGEPSEADRGWLDMTVDILESLKQAAQLLSSLAEASTEMTNELEARSLELERARGQADATRTVYGITLLVAKRMKQYCQDAEPRIAELEAEAGRFEQATADLAPFVRAESQEERDELANLRDVAVDALSTARNTLTALQEYREVLVNLENQEISQAMTRGARRVVRTAERMIGVIKVFESGYTKTIAMVDDVVNR